MPIEYNYNSRLPALLFDKLIKQIPDSTWDGRTFKADNDIMKLEVTVYSQFSDFLFYLTEVTAYKEIFFRDIYEVSSDSPVVIRFVQGDVYNREEEQLHILGAGNTNGVVLFSPQSNIDTKLIANSYTRMVTIQFNHEKHLYKLKEKSKAIVDLFKSHDPWVIYEPFDLQLEEVFNETFQWTGRGVGMMAMVASKVLALTSLFMIRLDDRLNKKGDFGITPSAEWDTLFAIKEELINNMQNLPTMEDLCKKYKINIKKLRRDFKNVFGFSPYQFVMRERLQRAHKLVESTPIPMLEISYELGFSDPSHFSKLFKEKFGITPLKLREQNLNNSI